MMRRRSTLIVALVLLAFTFTASEKVKKTPVIRITKAKTNRALLHVLPASAELQQLSSTLGALSNAQGPRADVLLQKATVEAWKAAELLANPMIQATSSAHSARRKLQQLVQSAPITANPELQAWMKSTASVWQAQAKQAQGIFKSLVQNTAQTAPAAASISAALGLPPLTPEALKSISTFINTTAQGLSLESSITGLIDSAFKEFSKTNAASYKINPKSFSMASGRRLQQSSDVNPAPESTVSDLVEAVDKIVSAVGSLGQATAVNVDLPIGADKRRILSDTPGVSSTNINTLAVQLQKRAGEAVASLKTLEEQGGGLISDEQTQKQLAAKASGLKDRFEKLKARVEGNKSQQQQRRLLQHGHTQQTMIVVMQPADAYASASFIEDVLGFLSDTIRSAFIPPQHSHPNMLLPNDYAEEAVLWVDDDYMIDYHDAGQEGNGDISAKRRKMLSSSSSSAAPSPGKPNFSAEESYDEYAYEDDDNDEWMWDSSNDDWMSVDASFEEAILRYADEASNEQLMDLVVKLVAPSAEGGISLELLNILTDPQGASVADLLAELARGPTELSVEMSIEMPRFAVFGSSARPGFGQSAAIGAQTARPVNKKEEKRVVDQVIGLKGPKPHSDRGDQPVWMDGRWLGIAFALAGLGLLMVGAAVAAMKNGNSYELVGGGEDYSGSRVVEKAGKENDVSMNPWESKGQVGKLKSGEKALRKTSGLPA